MTIGFVRIELLIYDVQSLKEKRSVVKSIRTKLMQRYNVAVSETGFTNTWQRTELGIVTISKEKTICERELQRALALIDSYPEVERTITEFEWL